MLLELRLPVALKHHILFQCVIQNKAVLVAVFRNVAHTSLASFADRFFCDVHAAKNDF